MFSQNRAWRRVEHNQLKNPLSYQDASPSIPFLLISEVLQLLKRTWHMGLHSPAARVSRAQAEIFVLTRSPQL